MVGFAVEGIRATEPVAHTAELGAGTVLPGEAAEVSERSARQPQLDERAVLSVMCSGK